MSSTATCEDVQLDENGEVLILPGGRRQIMQVFASPGESAYLLEVRLAARLEGMRLCSRWSLPGSICRARAQPKLQDRTRVRLPCITIVVQGNNLPCRLLPWHLLAYFSAAPMVLSSDICNETDGEDSAVEWQSVWPATKSSAPLTTEPDLWVAYPEHASPGEISCSLKQSDFGASDGSTRDFCVREDGYDDGVTSCSSLLIPTDMVSSVPCPDK